MNIRSRFLIHIVLLSQLFQFVVATENSICFFDYPPSSNHNTSRFLKTYYDSAQCCLENIHDAVPNSKRDISYSHAYSVQSLIELYEHIPTFCSKNKPTMFTPWIEQLDDTKKLFIKHNHTLDLYQIHSTMQQKFLAFPGKYSFALFKNPTIATLPIAVKHRDQNFYFVNLDRDNDKTKRITKINNIPIHRYIQRFKPMIPQTGTQIKNDLIACMLSVRIACLGDTIEKDVSCKITYEDENQLSESIYIPWTITNLNVSNLNTISPHVPTAGIVKDMNPILIRFDIIRTLGSGHKNNLPQADTFEPQNVTWTVPSGYFSSYDEKTVLHYKACVYSCPKLGNVGYVKVPTFSPSNKIDSIDACLILKEISNSFHKNANNVIIDLRGNTGGFTDYAQFCLSLFGGKRTAMLENIQITKTPQMRNDFKKALDLSKQTQTSSFIEKSIETWSEIFSETDDPNSFTYRSPNDDTFFSSTQNNWDSIIVLVDRYTLNNAQEFIRCLSNDQNVKIIGERMGYLSGLYQTTSFANSLHVHQVFIPLTFEKPYTFRYQKLLRDEFEAKLTPENIANYHTT
jgi:hypothetical protein